LLDTVTITLTT